MNSRPTLTLPFLLSALPCIYSIFLLIQVPLHSYFASFSAGLQITFSTLAMTWQTPTGGRTFHLANMEVDFDPQSDAAFETPPRVGFNIEGFGEIGTWRLPDDALACATVLWRLWDLPLPEPPCTNSLGLVNDLDNYAQSSRLRRIQ